MAFDCDWALEHFVRKTSGIIFTYTAFVISCEKIWVDSNGNGMKWNETNRSEAKQNMQSSRWETKEATQRFPTIFSGTCQIARQPRFEWSLSNHEAMCSISRNTTVFMEYLLIELRSKNRGILLVILIVCSSCGDGNREMSCGLEP